MITQRKSQLWVGKFKLSINTTSWCLCGQEMVVSDAWLSATTPVCMHATFESNKVSYALSHHFALAGTVSFVQRVLVPLFYLENSYFSFDAQLSCHICGDSTLPPCSSSTFFISLYRAQYNVYCWLIVVCLSLPLVKNSWGAGTTS